MSDIDQAFVRLVDGLRRANHPLADPTRLHPGLSDGEIQSRFEALAGRPCPDALAGIWRWTATGSPGWQSTITEHLPGYICPQSIEEVFAERDTLFDSDLLTADAPWSDWLPVFTTLDHNHLYWFELSEPHRARYVFFPAPPDPEDLEFIAEIPSIVALLDAMVEALDDGLWTDGPSGWTMYDHYGDRDAYRWFS